MREWPYVVVGFVFTLATGHYLVRRTLALLRDRVRVPPISPDVPTQRAWELVILHPDESGQWVGYAERIVFFVAIFMGGWEAVGVWFAFKVACKWEAWNHMGYVPDQVRHVDPLAYAFARRTWAAQGYATFIFGTFLNVLLASIGVVIAKEMSAGVEYLCQKLPF